MLPAIHRLPICEEISDLWAEIVANNPGMDVDAALAEAHRTIPDLLAEAAEWDQRAAAMRDTTPAPSVAYANAQTA